MVSVAVFDFDDTLSDRRAAGGKDKWRSTFWNHKFSRSCAMLRALHARGYRIIVCTNESTDHLKNPAPLTEQLTPKCVRTPAGEILDGHARICDELADGEHVIVDVGDGTPLSLVESRPFGEVLYQPEVNPEHEEVIEWEQHAENKRQSMRYSRIKVAARLSFDEWRARNTKTSEEELWEKFMAIWDAIPRSRRSSRAPRRFRGSRRRESEFVRGTDREPLTVLTVLTISLAKHQATYPHGQPY